MALVENDFILSSDPVEAEEWQATGTRLSDYWARVVNKPHSVPTKSAPSASQSAPEEIEPEESHLPPPIDIDIDIAASHAPETRTEPPTPCISRATLALSSPTTPLPASHSPAGPSLSSHSVQPPAPQSPTLPQLQTRSFRQRKPGQLNPYSLEQLKYAHSLSKTDWQDAIVPLKRQTEASAEELTKRKEWSKLRGEDDLDGWMVLEDGVRVRKEDVQHRQAEQGHAASKHKKRKRCSASLLNTIQQYTDSDHRQLRCRKTIAARTTGLLL